MLLLPIPMDLITFVSNFFIPNSLYPKPWLQDFFQFPSNRSKDGGCGKASKMSMVKVGLNRKPLRSSWVPPPVFQYLEYRNLCQEANGGEKSSPKTRGVHFWKLTPPKESNFEGLLKTWDSTSIYQHVNDMLLRSLRRDFAAMSRLWSSNYCQGWIRESQVLVGMNFSKQDNSGKLKMPEGVPLWIVSVDVTCKTS